MLSTITYMGRLAALQKLGMELQFNSPQEQSAHEAFKRKAMGLPSAVGAVGGTIGGAALGMRLGGPAAGLAGGILGGLGGYGLTKGVIGTAVDTAHDLPQHMRQTDQRTTNALNRSAGLPDAL